MSDWMLSEDDLKTSTGVELLEIATRITSDSELSIGEVNELRRWLKRNAPGTSIKPVRKLSELMDRIAADGIVDRDELIQLQMAVERVIPPLSLPPVKPATKKPTKKKEAPREKAAPMIRHIFSKVAGVTFENEDGTDRQAIIAHCVPREYLALAHQPSNRYSDVATKVLRLNNDMIGYLPEHLAEDVCAAWKSGKNVAACVTAITGGSHNKPTLGVNIAVFIAQPACEPQEATRYIQEVMAEYT